MSYIPTSWSEASDIASDIKKDVAITRTSVEGFINKIRAQATNLGNLAQPAPVGWQEWVAYVDTQAAANPDDLQWQNLKAEKDQIVADFLALLASVNAVVSAIDAV